MIHYAKLAAGKKSIVGYFFCVEKIIFMEKLNTEINKNKKNVSEASLYIKSSGRSTGNYYLLRVA